MQVDFYILAAEGPEAPLRFACRLVEKAWGLGHQVHVHTPSAESARALDALLWSFRQESFLPHALAEEVDGEPVPPVRIGHGDAAPAHPGDLLVNLDVAVPGFHDRFPRVAEVVPAGEAARAAGRDRYRRYRDRGLEPRSHRV